MYRKGPINLKKWIAILVLFILVLTACGKSESTNQGNNAHQDHVLTESGDIQESTTSVNELPSFLDDKSENIQIVYQLAANHAELLQWIPCYCGCGESAGHSSSLNCFVREIRKNGTVIWDDHGTRCQTCLEIALASVKMSQEGKSALEIRKVIDDTYSEGYAKPTDTKMPQA